MIGKSYKATAIVIRRIDFGETDKILALFSRERGKIPAIAKGARKSKSKLSGAVELLTFGKYELSLGRNLDIVTQADVKESFAGIRKDIRKAAGATYFLELTDHLLEEREPNPELFDLLLSSLYVLQNGANSEVLARGFEVKAMDILGYRPQAVQCVLCGETAEGGMVNFSPSAGGLVCGKCGRLPEDTIEVSKAAMNAIIRFLNTEPPDWKKLRFVSDVGQQLRNLMRWFIHFRIEREVKSGEFFRTLLSEEDNEK